MNFYWIQRYCDSYYKFLPQSKVISLGVDLVLSELKKQPKALIVCGSYTIGRYYYFVYLMNFWTKNFNDCVLKTKEKREFSLVRCWTIE